LISACVLGVPHWLATFQKKSKPVAEGGHKGWVGDAERILSIRLLLFGVGPGASGFKVTAGGPMKNRLRHRRRFISNARDTRLATALRAAAHLAASFSGRGDVLKCSQ